MKTPKPILERRRSVRIAESLPFHIGQEGYEIEARTLNVSSYGAMCVVEDDIPIMTQLKVALALPSGEALAAREHTIHAKGVVVRKEQDPITEKFFVAVYFSEINPKDQKALKDYIEQRLKR